MEKQWLHWMSIVAVIGTIACGDGTSISSDEPSFDCSQDSDCALVASSCCGCPNTAINIASVDAWNENLAENCVDTDCVAVECDPFTTRTASCSNNLCVVLE